MPRAEYIWRSFGRAFGWSLDKCELLVDLYGGDEDDQEEDLTESPELSEAESE
jgi:hypothetical protein